MNNTLKLILVASVALPILTGCGLRGGLERADPIFKDVEPVDQAVPAPEVVVQVRPRTNELGGELPLPAPTEQVESAALPDVPDQ
ncbi:MAG: hypothetical protein ABJG15_13380 [Hyphomonadaceae bacterium]